MKRQSKQSKITIKSVLCVLLLSGGISTFSSMSVNATTISYEPPSYSSLIPHDPISITSDGGLEVFPGSGTAEDPYLIEGYNITTATVSGIYIRDTTKHFIVRNCYVDAENYGIYIYNATDGTVTIENNTCSNHNYYGIYIRDSDSSIVSNNTCSNNNEYGMFFRYSDSPTVSNNTCTNNYHGIYLYFSSGSSTIVNNTCSYNNYYGIYLSLCGPSTVSNNTCIYNTNSGIYLAPSGSSTVSNNTCSYNNARGILLSHSNSSTIVNNTCNNNEYGIQTSYSWSSTVSNNTCSDNYWYGIWLWDSGSSKVANNTCNNHNYYGIYLLVSSGSTVVNNTCSYNEQDGIYLSSSGSSTVSNNTCIYNTNSGIFLMGSNSTVVNNMCIYNNVSGIYVFSSSGSTFANNTCTNNEYGIYLTSSASIYTVSNNTCTNNEYGIYLESSDSSTITNNTCNNNDYYGIYLYYPDFCNITYNLLQENGEYGIYLSSYSANNLIHHNTFVDNNLGGTSQGYDDGTNTYWYDTETQYGNDWSDWSGTGSYSIDGEAGAIDLYPLGESVDIDPPVITGIIHSPSTPIELNAVSIIATVTDAYGVQSVTLHYRVNGETWIEVSMTLVSGDLYSVTIGPFAVSDTIEYYVSAIDDSISHNEAIENNNGQYYNMFVGSSDVSSPIIAGIIHSPSTPTELDPICINATVTDDSGVQSVTLHYRVNGETWIEVSMTLISGDLYSVTIGGSFAVDDTIEYYITAVDNSVNHNEAIENNNGHYYNLFIGSSDVSSPFITDIIHSPSAPIELDIVSITATVTDASGVQSVTLHYRVNSGTWIEVSMTLVSGDLYSVTIGSFVVDYTIEYYISALDNSISHNEAINDNSGEYHSFTILSSEDETMAVMFSLLLPAITFLFLGFGIVVQQRRKSE